jgi:hypothetical protein
MQGRNTCLESQRAPTKHNNGFQQATIEHSKGMSMRKKGQKGTNKTQHAGDDKHQ